MNNHIKFQFYECSGFTKEKDVLDVIRIMQAHHVTLAQWHRLPGEAPQVIPFNGKADQYVSERYQDVELVDGDKIPLDNRRGPNRLSGAGLIPEPSTERGQPFSFAFDMFGKKFNMVTGSMITSREKVDVYGKFFLELTLDIYPILRPAFAMVDYADVSPDNIFSTVPRRKTSKVYWATFWGPDYVEKYGRDYITNAPMWKTVYLPDGGVLTQLCENISREGRTISIKEVKRYFVQSGVKYVN